MKNLLKLKRIYLILCAPLALILILLARLDNRWVERIFIPFIYKPLSSVIGSFVSFFPFSVTELVAVILCILIVIYLIKITISIIKKQVSIKKALARLGINVLCTVCVALLAFELSMGLNYYRAEAKEYLGLEVRPRSKEELYAVCEILVNDMNESRARMKTDGNGVAVLSDRNRTETSESARDAYALLSEKYPFLKSVNIKNKPLISSKLFSAVMTTGIYIPFTFESNINIDVPEFTIPATMCHELTHFRGFMRENEANFLGYLACMKSDRADFNYSGSLMAFEYCYSKLYAEDKQLSQQIANMCDDGIITDINAEDEYWAQYEDTIVSDVSGLVYEEYLNANGQESGLKSYGEMVDLLISYYMN